MGGLRGKSLVHFPLPAVFDETGGYVPRTPHSICHWFDPLKRCLCCWWHSGFNDDVLVITSKHRHMIWLIDDWLFNSFFMMTVVTTFPFLCPHESASLFIWNGKQGSLFHGSFSRRRVIAEITSPQFLPWSEEQSVDRTKKPAPVGRWFMHVYPIVTPLFAVFCT